MAERVCLILEGRLWYPFLLSPRVDEKTKEPKGYETGIIVSPDFDSKPVRGLMTSVAASKWGDDATKWPSDPPVHFAVKKAEDVKQFRGPDGHVLPEFTGCRLFSMNSQFAPDVADAQLQPLVDGKRVYCGVWARVAVTGAYAWTFKGKTGIGLDLGPVQIWKDGPALGARMNAADVFKAFAGTPAAVQKPFVSGKSPLDD